MLATVRATTWHNHEQWSFHVASLLWLHVITQSLSHAGWVQWRPDEVLADCQGHWGNVLGDEGMVWRIKGVTSASTAFAPQVLDVGAGTAPCKPIIWSLGYGYTAQASRDGFQLKQVGSGYDRKIKGTAAGNMDGVNFGIEWISILSTCLCLAGKYWRGSIGHDILGSPYGIGPTLPLRTRSLHLG